MVFRMIRWAFLGAVAGLILGGVAIGLSALDETAGRGEGPVRSGPPMQAPPPPPGASYASSYTSDFEVLDVVKGIATPYVLEGKIDRALAVIDAVDESLKAECLRWLAVAIAYPSTIEDFGGFGEGELPDEKASKQGAMTEEAKPAPKAKPIDFDKALEVAKMIKDSVVRASALSEIGKAQAAQPGPDQASRAAATREKALAALRLHYAEASTLRVGPIALRPLPRIILWPAGAAVIGLVLGVVGVPIVGSYGDAVGRSLAKEIGAARRPSP